jgi:adenylate kinase
LGVYHDQTKPLVDFYSKEAADGHCKYVKVDGTQSVDAIAAELNGVLS